MRQTCCGGENKSALETNVCFETRVHKRGHSPRHRHREIDYAPFCIPDSQRDFSINGGKNPLGRYPKTVTKERECISFTFEVTVQSSLYLSPFLPSRLHPQVSLSLTIAKMEVRQKEDRYAVERSGSCNSTAGSTPSIPPGPMSSKMP